MVSERFYRRASGSRTDTVRRALRAAEHLPDMLRFRGHAEATDLVHYMWLPMPSLDRRLLPPKRPGCSPCTGGFRRRAPGSAAP